MASQPQPAEPWEHRRGAVRTAVVWDVLRTLLATGDRFDVVDLGGGTGGFAVRIAELGHRVVVVEPSPDALASLDRRAAERQVETWVSGLQGDAGDLLDLVDPHSADLVLCHGVLEVVEDPAQALEAIATVLRPHGALSVVVAGRLAAVVTRALAGHFAAARALLEIDLGRWDVEIDGPRRYERDEIVAMLGARGFEPTLVHAVRVFADLVPSALVDTDPGAPQALLTLERAVAQRPEFAALASQLHVLATLAPG